jgi:hypothetical protein
MTRPALLLALAGALTTQLLAQTATIQNFGNGCTFLNPLAISATGLPQLGTTFDIHYSGPNLNNQISTQPVLVLGLASNNQPIPQSILAQQPFGCSEHVVPEVFLVMPPTSLGTFVDQVTVAVPNNPNLIGFAFVAQWLAIVIQCGIIPPCTLDALPTSDALLITCGL